METSNQQEPESQEIVPQDKKKEEEDLTSVFSPKLPVKKVLMDERVSLIVHKYKEKKV